MGTGAEDGCTIHDCMAGFPHGDARSLSLVATRLHRVSLWQQDFILLIQKAALFVVSPNEAAPGRLPGHLRSLGGSSKFSGMMVSHVRRGALTAHSGIRGARPRPFAMHDAQRRKTAWHDAMLSIRNRRFPRKNSRMLCFSCRQPPAFAGRREATAKADQDED